MEDLRAGILILCGADDAFGGVVEYDVGELIA